jgi:hypothetical protein
MRTRLFSWLIPLCAIVAASAAAGPPSAGEYEIKAAFLYNFIRFVEWPEDAFAADDNVVICILGEDPFGDDLDRAVLDKVVHERAVVVQRLSAAEQLERCHVLFLSQRGVASAAQLVANLGKSPILTVSEEPELLAAGGIIAFAVRDNRVRFRVNLAAATQARLKISSKLLQLAESVIGRPGEGM